MRDDSPTSLSIQKAPPDSVLADGEMQPLDAVLTDASSDVDLDETPSSNQADEPSKFVETSGESGEHAIQPPTLGDKPSSTLEDPPVPVVQRKSQRQTRSRSIL